MSCARSFDCFVGFLSLSLYSCLCYVLSLSLLCLVLAPDFAFRVRVTLVESVSLIANSGVIIIDTVSSLQVLHFCHARNLLPVGTEPTTELRYGLPLATAAHGHRPN